MKDRDKLAFRLSYILSAFNNGDRLKIKDLAKEFNVDIRTIYRDLSRLEMHNLPLIRENGYVWLDSSYLGKYSLKDFIKFKKVSGIERLYPVNFPLENILDKQKSAPLKVNLNISDIDKKEIEFEKIQNAINDKKIISFYYKDKKRVVKPYQLLNKLGVWYIVAVEGDKIKTFTLEKIKMLNVFKDSFKFEKKFLKIIKNNPLSWYSNESFEVVLEVSNEVLYYFERKEIFPNQKIIDYKKDIFIVSSKASFEDEILSIVRFWIPHIFIISPKNLQEKLVKSLKDYFLKYNLF